MNSAHHYAAEAADGEVASDRQRLAHHLFHLYKQVISPALHAGSGTGCKYLPTCSEYAYVAVARHGWTRGLWLALKRLARCHPFASGGADPVP